VRSVVTFRLTSQKLSTIVRVPILLLVDASDRLKRFS
jgi:hypothetical protein